MPKVVVVQDVCKKFSSTLKRSMLYGLQDIGRNVLGLSSRSSELRPGEFWAVDQASFSLEQGETLGIIGPNGSGKSTLLKMLSGIYWPDKGKITIKGRVGALIEVGAGFHPMLTGRENIFINAAILGMKKNDLQKRIDDIIQFAGIGKFLNTPVKYYSSGMYVRLGFSIAVHCRPDILLIDEILAVGDMDFQARCLSKISELKKNGTAIILVSHNSHLISTNSNQLLVFLQGKPKLFTDVNEGTLYYSEIFKKTTVSNIEKLVTGTPNIHFSNIEIEKATLAPGESFVIKIPFTSEVDFEDIIVDMGIYTENEQSFYYQATNHAYDYKLNLKKGEHVLQIQIFNIQINKSFAKIALAIWDKNKQERLFWWRIPVEFTGHPFSHGKNFLHAKIDVFNQSF